MDLTWINDYEEETAIGPVQRDEALFLHALARVIRPRRVLEFGTHKGHSAKAWLEAGAELWTVDVCPSIDPAFGLDQYGNKFHAITGNMVDFKQPENVVFDIVFFDASHHFGDNRRTFLNLDRPKLVVVHDTGTWAEDHMLQIHHDFRGGQRVADGIIHQPEEIRFVEWLEYVGYSRIDFHSMNTVRHGITILQQKP